MKNNIKYFVLLGALMQLGLALDVTNAIKNHKSEANNVFPDLYSPTINEVVALSPCILHVGWSCASCPDEFDGFNVYWQQTGSQVIVSSEVSRKSNFYNIEDLISDQSYTVWVSSVIEGEDHSSDLSEASTNPGEPEIVTGVTTEVVSDSVITVSWTKTSNECPIQGYFITWNGTAIWDPTITSIGIRDTDDNTTSIDAANLIPYSDYFFYVREITTDGLKGKYSEPSYAATEQGAADPPTPVTSTTIDSSSVEVTWSTPYMANGVITDYHISCQLLPDTTDQCDVTTESEEVFFYIVEGLLACGNYTFNVQAINEEGGLGEPGTDSSRTDAEAPPDITNFQVKEVTSTTANLTWDSLDTNCPVLYYTLEVQGDVLWSDEADAFILEFSTEENFYLLENLIYWTAYSLNLTATTEGGTTNPTSTEFQTFQNSSSGAPVIVELTSTSPCSLVVIWNCDETCLNGLNNFKIYWQQTGVQETSEVTEGYNANFFEIEGLLSDQSYTVWVSSVKSDGEYLSDLAECYTKTGDPQIVTGVTSEVVSDSVITVSWTKTSNTCPIQGYSVTWNGTANWDSSIKPIGRRDTDEDTTSIDASNLTPYSSYFFYVREITSDGLIGEYSEPSYAATEQGAADPPTPVTSTTIDSSSVEVTWSTPYMANGIITSYHISCQLLPDTTDQCDHITTDSEFEAFSYIAEDLLACGNYTFNVQAINEEGDFGESGTALSRTDAEVPPPIGNFLVENITSTSAFLSWTPPATNCPVLYYILQGQGEVLSSGNTTDEINLILNAENNYYSLQHLIPYTIYTLALSALTEGGTTDPTSVVFQTLQDG